MTSKPTRASRAKKLAPPVRGFAKSSEEKGFLYIRSQWRIRRSELDRWLDAQPRGGPHGEG